MDKILRSEGEADGVIVAVGYIRTSGDGVEAEASAEAQRVKIQKLADGCGVKIVDWQVDVGYSGKDLHRLGLQALLASAEAPNRGFNTVLVSAWNRLSRRPADLARIHRRDVASRSDER